MALRKFFALAALPALFTGAVAAQSPGSYVDPNIGGVAPLLTTVTPQVHRPFSMVRIYPVTKSGLNDRYLSDRIYGIALNMPRYRLGECGSIMATTGRIDPEPEGNSSWFDHDIEQLHPWSHSLWLDDFGIRASWTTTERSSVYRFDYGDNPSGNVIFRCLGEGSLSVTGQGTVTGWEWVGYAKQYFYAEATAGFGSHGIIQDGTVRGGSEVEGEQVGVWLTTGYPGAVEFRVGISYISVEQARDNLNRENAGRSWEEVARESQGIWEEALGRIRVEGGTEREKRIFYTSLYRTFERMVDQSEYGRYYSGFDRRVHTDPVPFYNDDWLWDTYRNLHALQMILDPETKALHLASQVRMARQWGWVPQFPELADWDGDWVGPWSDRWRGEPMIGNHSAALLAEAVRKGITGFDLESAYELNLKNALEGTMVPWRSGPAMELDHFYRDNGYFPALAPGEDEPYGLVDHGWEKRQAVSVTIEHSYDDWCLAQVAAHLGREDDYRLLMERSRNYLNLWNPETGFFAPRDVNGRWVEPFDPERCDGYGARSYFAENNAWIHAFHIQHDIPQLISLMGGEEGFIGRLDEAFTTGPAMGKWQFMGVMPDATGLHGMIPTGNEPAFHVPYLYNYAGAAWKTQHRVRQVADLWFDDRPTGLSGDDDGGSLTAWYVFSAMGFYPVNPASGEYAIGSPIFEKVEIDLPDGKVFTVEAPGSSRRNKYIRSATLNGCPLDVPFITHEDIMAGGTLSLVMDEMPNKEWGK